MFVKNRTLPKERLRVDAVKHKDCGIHLRFWNLESHCLNLTSQIQIKERSSSQLAIWGNLKGMSSTVCPQSPFMRIREYVVMKNRKFNIFCLEIQAFSCLSKGLSSYSDALIVLSQISEENKKKNHSLNFMSDVSSWTSNVNFVIRSSFQHFWFSAILWLLKCWKR